MEIKLIQDTIKEIIKGFFEQETSLKLGNGKTYYIPESRFRRLFINLNCTTYQLGEVGYASEHLQAKIDAFYEDLAVSLKDSKNFYKKVKKAVDRYIQKQTPKSAYNVLYSIGVMEVALVNSSSGNLEFCDNHIIVRFYNPEELKVNEKKRELKEINKELRSHYIQIEQLKQRKTAILES